MDLSTIMGPILALTLVISYVIWVTVTSISKLTENTLRKHKEDKIETGNVGSSSALHERKSCDLKDVISVRRGQFKNGVIAAIVLSVILASASYWAIKSPQKAQRKSLDLRRAVKEGDLGTTIWLLESGVDVNQDDFWRLRTPLYYAASNDDALTVKLLIKAGADVNASDYYGKTPLHAACINGYLSVASVLIANGADIDRRSHSNDDYWDGGILPFLDRRRKEDAGWTPLHYASSNGHLSLVRLLVAKGADVNKTDEDGWAPLHAACSNGKLEAARMMIDAGADINQADRNGLTPLHYAGMDGNLAVARMLIEKGADVDASVKHGETIWTLGNEGDYIQIDGGNSLTPLHLASQEGHLQMVELLLDQGADVNRPAKDGRTTLHYSSRDAHYTEMQSSRYNWSYTAPCRVCSGEHFAVAQLLVRRGADVASADSDGRTPLHAASFNGHLSVAEFLAEHGAEVNNADKNGLRPLHYTARLCRLSVAQMLVRRGADVMSPDRDGWTPLGEACGNRCVSIADMLIRRGAYAERVVNIEK